MFDVTSSEQLWVNTTVTLPKELVGKRFRDVFSGERRTLPETLDLTSDKGYVRVLITCDEGGE